MHKISCFTAVAPFLLASSIAFGAQGPIYKCAQPDGTPLYSDYPCGGTVVDVHPGSADPNAKERLARAQAELDRAAAARRASEQEIAARREELDQLRRQSDAAQNMVEPASNASDIYYGSGYDGYGSYTHGRAQRPNFHGGARGHRASHKSRFHHGEGRVPAVIRRP
jgi:hypothetical protein